MFTTICILHYGSTNLLRAYPMCVYGVLLRHSPRVRFRPNDTLMMQLDVKICDLHYSGGSVPDMRFTLDHSEQDSNPVSTPNLV